MIEQIKERARLLFDDLSQCGPHHDLPELKLEDVYELMFFNAKRQNNLEEAREIMQAFREELDIIDPTRLEK